MGFLRNERKWKIYNISGNVMTVKVWEFLKIVIRLVATKTSLATVTIIVISSSSRTASTVLVTVVREQVNFLSWVEFSSSTAELPVLVPVCFELLIGHN